MEYWINAVKEFGLIVLGIGMLFAVMIMGDVFEKFSNWLWKN